MTSRARIHLLALVALFAAAAISFSALASARENPRRALTLTLAPATPSAPAAATTLAARSATSVQFWPDRARRVATDPSLDFQSQPAWIHRLERTARYGLPMLRLHSGRRSSLVFGMNPNGYIGVFTLPVE